MDIISLREMFIDFFARFHMVCDRYTSYFDHFIFFQHNSPLSLPKKGKKSSHTFLVKNVCFLFFSFAASNQFFVLPGLVTFSEQMTSSEVFTFLWGGSRHVTKKSDSRDKAPHQDNQVEEIKDMIAFPPLSLLINIVHSIIAVCFESRKSSLKKGKKTSI